MKTTPISEALDVERDLLDESAEKYPSMEQVSALQAGSAGPAGIKSRPAGPRTISVRCSSWSEDRTAHGPYVRFGSAVERDGFRSAFDTVRIMRQATGTPVGPKDRRWAVFCDACDQQIHDAGVYKFRCPCWAVS